MNDDEIIAMAREKSYVETDDVQILDKAEVEIILEDGEPVGAWVEARLWVSL